ncbi:hypothetical protein KEM52_006397 [Ascosphaera acerosa]|nr:hypothetical protein KEM52_006397 [Ascosphaera acerosa]
METDGDALTIMTALLEKATAIKRRKPLPAMLLKTSNSNAASRGISGLIKLAVQLKNLAMVSLISRYADQCALDGSLKQCLLERELQPAASLLRNGADPAAHCADIFLACARNRDLAVVQLLCSASRKPSPATLDAALAIAASQEELQIIAVLLQSGANGDQCELLCAAVHAGAVDVVSALILSVRPPTPMSLDKAMDAALAVQDPGLQETLAEVLLCGGATGPAVNRAVQTSVEAGRDRVLALLVEHGASVTCDNGTAILTAIVKGNLHAACTLLAGRMTATVASHVLASLPTVGAYLSPEQRFALTWRLVDCKAFGDSLAVVLVDAVERHEAELIEFLLDAGASVDYDNAKALRCAVASADLPLLTRLLEGPRPMPSSLDACFPLLQSLAGDKRFACTTTLLEAGARGPAVDQALAVVTADPAVHRQDELIRHFVLHGADVNVGKGACFAHAVKAGSIPILSILLSGRPSAASLARGIMPACQLPDSTTRFTVLDLLVSAGAQGSVVDLGLRELMQSEPVDVPVVALLLEKGAADVNSGDIVRTAASHGNVDLLNTLLQYGPSPASLGAALPAAIALEQSAVRNAVCQSLLTAGATGEAVNEALLTAQPLDPPDPTLLRLLIAHGADINYRSGAAIRAAVQRRELAELALLLSSEEPPSSETLFLGLSEVLGIESDRACEFARALLDVGRRRSLDVINRILLEAVKARQGVQLLDVFLEYGANINFRDGLPLRHAIEARAADIVDLLLRHKTTPSTLENAFRAALGTGKEYRSVYILRLLKAGYHGQSLNPTLLDVVCEDPCDIELLEVLLHHDASPHVARDEAFHRAAAAGDNATLRLLFDHCQDDTTASAVFSRLVRTGDAWQHESCAEVVLTLLQYGVEHVVLSEALLQVITSPTRSPHKGVLAGLLMQRGADPCYHDGRILRAAISSGDPSLCEPLLTSDRIPAAMLSSAFSLIFSSGLSEAAALAIFQLFLRTTAELGDLTGPEYCSEGSLLEPISFTALRLWPAGTAMVDALLKAGVSTEKTMPHIIDEEEGVEQVSLLLWTLLQSPATLTAEVIQTLLQNGGMCPNTRRAVDPSDANALTTADVNFQSPKSAHTPLLVAAQLGRADIVALLLAEGADLTLTDIRGHTALIQATRSADILTIRSLLEASAPVDDGSLHEAARAVDPQIVHLLIQNGHDANHASPLHYGRSALAELCMDSSCHATRLDRLQATVKTLVNGHADLTVRVHDKPLIMHAMENPHASVELTRLILTCGLWSRINDPCCQYVRDGRVYSPTTYITSGLCASTRGQDLLRLLRASGCRDTDYGDVYESYRSRHALHACTGIVAGS